MDKVNNYLLVVLIIIALWSTYQFGYNKGFNDATIREDLNQNKTLNALQVANDYQEKWLKCIEYDR